MSVRTSSIQQATSSAGANEGSETAPPEFNSTKCLGQCGSQRNDLQRNASCRQQLFDSKRSPCHLIYHIRRYPGTRRCSSVMPTSAARCSMICRIRQTCTGKRAHSGVAVAHKSAAEAGVPATPSNTALASSHYPSAQGTPCIASPGTHPPRLPPRGPAHTAARSTRRTCTCGWQQPAAPCPCGSSCRCRCAPRPTDVAVAAL